MLPTPGSQSASIGIPDDLCGLLQVSSLSGPGSEGWHRSVPGHTVTQWLHSKDCRATHVCSATTEPPVNTKLAVGPWLAVAHRANPGQSVGHKSTGVRARRGGRSEADRPCCHKNKQQGANPGWGEGGSPSRWDKKAGGASLVGETQPHCSVSHRDPQMEGERERQSCGDVHAGSMSERHSGGPESVRVRVCK